MCLLGCTFNAHQAVNSSALGFTSCLHRVSKTDNNESLGPSQLCHYINTCSPGHACGLIDLQHCVTAFQSPLWMDILFPSFFFKPFPPTTHPSPQEAVILAIADVWFWQTHQRKWLFALGKLQVQIKKNSICYLYFNHLLMKGKQKKEKIHECSREPSDRSNNDSSFKMGFWRCCITIPHHPVAARLLFLDHNMNIGYCSSWLPQSLGRGESSKLKMPQSSLLLSNSNSVL